MSRAIQIVPQVKVFFVIGFIIQCRFRCESEFHPTRKTGPIQSMTRTPKFQMLITDDESQQHHTRKGQASLST